MNKQVFGVATVLAGCLAGCTIVNNNGAPAGSTNVDASASADTGTSPADTGASPDATTASSAVKCAGQPCTTGCCSGAVCDITHLCSAGNTGPSAPSCKFAGDKCTTDPDCCHGLVCDDTNHCTKPCLDFSDPCGSTAQCCAAMTCKGGGGGQAGVCNGESTSCAHYGDPCTTGSGTAPTDCCAGVLCLPDTSGKATCSAFCSAEHQACDATNHPCCQGLTCGSGATCVSPQLPLGSPCRSGTDCVTGVSCTDGVCGGLDAGTGGACVAFGGGCGSTAIPCCPGLTCDNTSTFTCTSQGGVVPDGSVYFDGGCGAQTFSGADTPETHVVDMGKTSGTFTFDYNTYSIPDEIRVYYESATLFDTGCVGATGHPSLKFSGGTRSVTVQVFPNCNGNTSGTAWDFTVGCPQ